MRAEWVPLGDVLRLAQDAVSVRPDEGYPSAGVLNRGRGLFDKGILAGSATSYGRLFRLAKGQVVYSKLFGWEGAVAIVPCAFDGYFVSSEFPTFEVATDHVSTDYLGQYLKSEQFTDQMSRSTNGLGQRRQRVNIDAFLKIEVALPSLVDQERIASHLMKLEPITRPSTVDSGAVVEHLISAAAHRAKAAPLGELLQSHRPWMEIDTAGSYRAIGVRGFGRGMIRYPEGGAEALSKLRYYPLRPGALIVSNIKGWEGAVCVAAESDAGRIASNRFLQYIPKDPRITTGWVEQYLLSPAGLASLNAASPGSADRNRTLSMAAFEAIDIPVPTPKTQEAVMRVVRALRGVSAEQARRDELAAAVLPAARNGIFSSMR